MKTTNPLLRNIIGKCYEYEEGVPQDFTKAIEFYKKAIELDNLARSVREAQYSLGTIYITGKGVSVSIETELKYLIHAANVHSLKSQWKVAIMFELGTGVAADQNRAFHYFGLAARGGHEKAHLKVEKYLVKRYGVVHPRLFRDQIEEEDKKRNL